MTTDEKRLEKAAEHLGSGALKLIKAILIKHDAAIIEASQEAIEAAVAAERDRCCAIVFSQCDSDNVAQRTVDAMRSKT